VNSPSDVYSYSLAIVKWTNRYGVFQPMALICSTLIMVATTSVLSFLWQWSMLDDPDGIRSKLALADRTTSVIAICSAILRTCITVQLGVCCMITASIAFQKDAVLLRDAAAMSIYRYSVASPYSLAFPVWRGTRIGNNYFSICLVALLSLIAVLSQFTSTILVSDTCLGYILGTKETVSLAYGYSNAEVRESGSEIAIQIGVEFPRFAENTAESFSISSNLRETGPGLSDTGPTIRALLPLSKSNRSSLLSYHGMATLIDSHVLCVSPNLDRLQYKGNTLWGNLSTPFLDEALASGKIQAQGSFSGNITGPLSYLSFSCDQVLMYGDGDPVTHLCPVREVLISNRSGNSPEPGFPAETLVRGLNYWWLGIRYIPLNNRSSSSLPLYSLFDGKGYKYDGTEWITKSETINGTTRTASMTLCVSTFQFIHAKIGIKSIVTATEPEYKVARGLGPGGKNYSKVYNTTSIQTQLGANTGYTHEQRDIFDLTDYDREGLKEAKRHNWHMEFLHDGNTAISSGPRMDPIAILYGSIFTGTLERAKTASVALQAVLTMVTTNYYYENLGHFDKFGNSIVQNAQPVIVPMTNTGLMTVYGIIGLHLLTVGAVFWVYFTFCARPLKFLDQAWQTVGLLHCGDANAFLGDTINKWDKDIGELPLATRGYRQKSWQKGNGTLSQQQR